MASKDREVWEHHHEDEANAKSERANFNNIGIKNSIINNGADRANKSGSRSGGDGRGDGHDGGDGDDDGDDDDSSRGAMTGDDRHTDHAWDPDKGQRKRTKDTMEMQITVRTQEEKIATNNNRDSHNYRNKRTVDKNDVFDDVNDDNDAVQVTKRPYHSSDSSEDINKRMSQDRDDDKDYSDDNMDDSSEEHERYNNNVRRIR